MHPSIEHAIHNRYDALHYTTDAMHMMHYHLSIYRSIDRSIYRISPSSSGAAASIVGVGASSVGAEASSVGAEASLVGAEALVVLEASLVDVKVSLFGVRPSLFGVGASLVGVEASLALHLFQSREEVKDNVITPPVPIRLFVCIAPCIVAIAVPICQKGMGVVVTRSSS